MLTLPAKGPIQFMPPGGAYLTVTGVTDPNGAPLDVIDVDQGFSVSGQVVLPNWLGGNATVCIWADEQGGPIDQALSPCFDLTLKPSATEPNPKTYDWKIDFPGTVLPDPHTGSQIYHLLAKFMYENQATDIAGFADMGYALIN
jgi:hypothetical protein